MKDTLPNGLDLGAIAPGRAAMYSPNLWKYLAANKVPARYATGFRHRHEGTLWLGYIHDGEFVGTKLMQVLCQGARACAGCYVGLAPRLDPLWLSKRTEAAMAKAELLPRQGVADAPVTVTGYAEPSLVFALGTETELGSPDDAAEAIVEHRPAVVEARQQAAFERSLAAAHVKAQEVAEVKGLDYSDGHKMTLRIYKAPADAPPAPGDQVGDTP